MLSLEYSLSVYTRSTILPAATAFPRLREWLFWYHKTQQGPLRGSYRWRGRNATIKSELNPKTLSSGNGQHMEIFYGLPHCITELCITELCITEGPP